MAEIAETVESRDMYRTKFEEEREGLRRLRTEHKQLKEWSTRLVSKEEFEQTQDERDALLKKLKLKTKE